MSLHSVAESQTRRTRVRRKRSLIVVIRFSTHKITPHFTVFSP